MSLWVDIQKENPPLWILAMANPTEELRKLLSQSKASTLQSDLKTMDALLAQGARLDFLLLFDALKALQGDIVHWILKNDPTIIQRTPGAAQILLNKLVGMGNSDFLNDLLVYPAIKDVINTPNEEGLFPIDLALMDNNTDVAEVLLKNGAELYNAGLDLRDLIYHGIENALQWLLKKKAGLEAIEDQDPLGYTPFLIAIQNNKIEMAKALLKLKADRLHRNTFGHNALMLATLNNNIETINFLVNVVNLPLNEVSNDCETAFYMAVASGKDEAALELLRLGADPMMPNKEGETPRDQAISRGNYHLMEMLKLAEREFQQKDLKRYHEYKNFCEKCQLVKQSAGHPLGLSTTFPVYHVGIGGMINVKSEGSLSIFSVQRLEHAVQDYINEVLGPKSKQNAESQELFDFFKLISQAVTLEKEYHMTRTMKVLKRLTASMQNESTLTFVPCCWVKHDIAVGRFGPFLLMTNRGEGRLEHGAYLYKLNKDVELDEIDILALYPTGERLPLKKIQANFLRLVDLQYHPIPIASTPQKHGTCSFVNRKSNIEPALFAMKLMQAGPKVLSEIFSILKLPDMLPKLNESDPEYEMRTQQVTQDILLRLSQNLAYSTARNFSERHYKRFTKFIRDDQINKLLQIYKQAKQNGQLDHCDLILNIFEQYLKVHSGRITIKPIRGEIPKFKTELVRAENILASLPGSERQLLVDRLRMGFVGANPLSVLLSHAIRDGNYNLVKLAIPDFNPNGLGTNAMTLLMQAVALNDLESVKRYLQAFPKADPDVVNLLGQTAYSLAKSSPEIAKILDEHRLSLKSSMKRRQEALDILHKTNLKSWKEDQKQLEVLLNEGADIFHSSSFNGVLQEGALTVAVKCAQKNFELGMLMVKWLLEKIKERQRIQNISLDEFDLQGLTPLMHACIQDNEAILKMLIDHGADFDLKDSQRNGLLAMAVIHNKKAMTDFILNRTQIQVDVHNTQGWTALSFAVGNNFLEIAKMLINKGADPTLQDISTQTLLAIASRTNHPEMVRYLLSIPAFTKFLRTDMTYWVDAIYGALEVRDEGLAKLIVEAAPLVDDRQISLLEQSAWIGSLDTIKFLLRLRTIQEQMQESVEYGFLALVAAFRGNFKDIFVLLLNQIPTFDEQGHTLLMRMVRFGDIELLKLALAQPDIRKTIDSMETGRTIFCEAVLQDSKTIAELLMSEGADISIPDFNGNTAEVLAVEFGSYDLLSSIVRIKENKKKQNKAEQETIIHYIQELQKIIYAISQPLEIRTEFPVIHPCCSSTLVGNTHQGFLLPSLQANTDIFEHFQKTLKEFQQDSMNEIQQALKMAYQTALNPNCQDLRLKQLNDPRTKLTFLPVRANGESGTAILINHGGEGYLVTSTFAWNSNDISVRLHKVKPGFVWNEEVLNKLTGSIGSTDLLDHLIEPLLAPGTNEIEVDRYPWQPGMEHFWMQLHAIHGILYAQELFKRAEKQPHILRDFFDDTKTADPTNSTLLEVLTQNSKVEYDRLMEGMQEQAVQQLTNSYQQAKKTNRDDLVQIYSKLIVEYMYQNFRPRGATEQSVQFREFELKMLNMILQDLDKMDRDKFIRQLKERAIKEGIKWDVEASIRVSVPKEDQPAPSMEPTQKPPSPRT